MSRPQYPWYPYIKNILRKYQNTTEREKTAIDEALAAADTESREIVHAVYISRTMSLRAAAQGMFLSYATAQRRATSVIRDIAHRLGLLD